MSTDNKNEKLLSIKGLVVEFVTDESTVHAVNNVSLDINRGETLGLVGETGAGKTTIAKSILRILPDPPSKVRSGEILFEGQDLMSLPEPKMRKVRGKQISMIFQDPMTALDPVISVGRQIAETVYLHEDVTKKQAEERAAAMLEMVGIPRERFHEYPHQFSGGMKQRVVIAIALACHPKLLLADEPTTALDVTVQAQVLSMMAKLKEELNTSMLLITHDLGIVAENCDKVAVIYAGEIVEHGTAEELFDHPRHPYTLGLFGSLPSMTENKTRLKPILGMMPNPAALPEGCKFWPRCPHADDGCKGCNPPGVEVRPEHYVKCLKVKEEIR